MQKVPFILALAILLTACQKEETSLQSNEVIFESRANAKVKAPADLIEVEILESNSDFDNLIELVSPVYAAIGSDNSNGTVVDMIPTVTAGVELIFQITTPEGNVWQTGPGIRNSDGRKHAVVDKLVDKSSIVMFEDIDASGWGTADEPNFIDAIIHVRERTP